jgi:hypothetical protein
MPLSSNKTLVSDWPGKLQYLKKKTFIHLSRFYLTFYLMDMAVIPWANSADTD